MGTDLARQQGLPAFALWPTVLSVLPPATYLLRVLDATGQVSIRRFVRQ